MRPRVATLLALCAACAAPADVLRGNGRGGPPAVVPAGWRLADEDGVRPTLEEIFLDVPPCGSPPDISSASADARFALVDWRGPGEEEEHLRLVDACGPADPGVGQLLAELLPPVPPAPEGTPADALDTEPVEQDEAEEEDEPELVADWSPRGSRLAVGRRGEVWILDPEREERFLLARWEPAPEEPDEPEEEERGEQEEGLEDAAELAAAIPPEEAPPETTPEPEPEAVPEEPPPPPRAVGAVAELAFSRDGSRLRVGDGEELFELPVPLEPPAEPLGLEQAVWWSLDVEAPAEDLVWSDDLTVVVGVDPLPRAERAPEAHVWRTLERRAVVLAGLAQDAELEEESLSPDGRFFFALEVDRSAEPEPTEIPDFLTARVSHSEGRRLLADDRPSPARPVIWDTASGARTELVFEPLAEGAEPPRFHWNAVGWSRPGAGPPVLCLERFSEDRRELVLWTFCEGELRRVHAERDEGWVGGPARDTLIEADGRGLLIGSETAPGTTTPGRSQAFRLDLASGALRQLTEVAGEVTDISALDDGGVLVVASGEDPRRREAFFIAREAARLSSGAAPARAFAFPAGFKSDVHAAVDGSRALALCETLLAPAEVVAADFAGARAVTRATPEAYAELELATPERLIVRAPDGADVHSHVYLPPGVALAGGGPPRAAVVFIHGAGYLQNVADSMTRYPLNALFHARLARLGYVVLDVDYRGSAGYGGAFRTAVQGHLGGRDLADVHLAVDELVARGLVDPRRVGCYGGSYGGFLTLMALFTAPERWSVGCALRSVTDWRSYHPDYTQQRLGRPSQDPEAYARSSPIDHVGGLADPLLVLHGMADSNVFVQDSVRLIEALIDAGKEFDAMLYPSQGHAFEDGEHWLDEYRRIERFLIAHLGPPLVIDGGFRPHPHEDGDDDQGSLALPADDARSGGR